MKPVAIFRLAETEGPGYFVEFLNERSIYWRYICIDEGDDVPLKATDYSGLVFMGGPMSVNDDLPWIPPVLALIRQAVSQDVPVLGHCLGGQLLAKAVGAEVTLNPVKEIGWGKVTVSDNDQARAWFGDIRSFEAFHWHGETFSLPYGAVHLLSSQYCANQAFAMDKHLGLQCHVEMTEPMIRSWCEVGAAEIANSPRNPAVQSRQAILGSIDQKLPQLNAVASQLYQHWVAGLD